MLKDVEMEVPKKCSKQGSIHAAKKGMMACNNNMRNPSFILMGLCILLLLHFTLIDALESYLGQAQCSTTLEW